MDALAICRSIDETGTTQYEQYLCRNQLVQCQKPYADLVNGDELQFQIVHQVEELWMKLVAYTLLDVNKEIERRNTNKVRSLFARVHKIAWLMISQLSLLETMSPIGYHQIRDGLGSGSGQESPGFRIIQQMGVPLYRAFTKHYLENDAIQLIDLYKNQDTHTDAYTVAECLIEYDDQIQKFRYQHLQLVKRTIGFSGKSTKGIAIKQLKIGLDTRLFPDLWEVREKLTDYWATNCKA